MKAKRKSDPRQRSLASQLPSSGEIDLSEIPEFVDWSAAERGRFYRPRKELISIRLDADVLDWFRSQPGPYQRRINEACRDYARKHSRDGGSGR
jgi:uncharacterized protein (DUF4415 family)